MSVRWYVRGGRGSVFPLEIEMATFWTPPLGSYFAAGVESIYCGIDGAPCEGEEEVHPQAEC